MSPQQKRSTQYDWFKGKAANGGKKTPKQNAKVVWKFTKIFIYLTLFVFSMTGCIQTFVVKTQNSVGRGVEFYSSEKEVAPHVTTFQPKSVKATDKATDVYELNSIDTNYWLSDKSLESDTDLKAIHKEVLTQNAKKDLRLQDSFKGSVETIRLLDEHQPLDKARILTDGTNPYVLSSKSISSSTGIDNTITITAKVLGFVPGTPAIKATAVKKAVPKVDSKYVIKDAKFEIPTGIAAGTSDEARLKYANSLVAAIYDNYKSTIFSQISPTTAAGTEVKVNSPEYYKAESQTKVFEQILAYAGYKANEKTNDANAASNEYTYTYEKGYLPGLGTGKTDWRPLVTWSDAWGEGPFYGLFVFPVAYVAANMIKAMPFMAGWETLISIFVVVFIIRMITFALSFKATMQQTKMQELTSKKAVIDAKYAAYKGNKQMEQRQKQEVSDMYKKEGVSVFGSISTIFLTMPFFLAIWRTIGALPHIKSTIWLGINFSATSWRELFSGEYQYLPLMIVAAAFAAFQQILPRLLTRRRDKNRINVHQKAAMKKGNKTQNIMMLVFVFMALIFSAGLQVYWIAGGLWMVIQSIVTHKLIIRQSKNKKRRKIKA